MTTSLPDSMTGIVLTGKGGPEVLEAQTVAVPAPREHEVLVRVEAAGVNRP